MLYLQLLQNPIPASRPRVTRFGVYFGKRYTQYRKQAHVTIEEAIGKAKAEGILPIDSYLIISQLFEIQKPKTSKLEFPLPDLDNLNKALWDALQSHGVIKDDRQVLASIETKRWTTTQPQTHIIIQTVTSSDINHAMTAEAQTLVQNMMTATLTALAVEQEGMVPK
jgi:Holliday junction resolvase RusA-like endonuclease